MEFFRLLIFIRLGFLMMIVVVLGIYLLPVCHPCVFLTIGVRHDKVKGGKTAVPHYMSRY